MSFRIDDFKTAFENPVGSYLFVIDGSTIGLAPKEEVENPLPLEVIAAKIDTINPSSLPKPREKALQFLYPSIRKLIAACEANKVPLPRKFALPFFGFCRGYLDTIPKARGDWLAENFRLDKKREKSLIKGACRIGLSYCPCVSDVRRYLWENKIINQCLSLDKDRIKLLCVGPGYLLDVHVLLSRLHKDTNIHHVDIDFYDISPHPEYAIALLRYWKQKAPGFVSSKHLFLNSLEVSSRYDVGFAMDFEPLERAYNDEQEKIKKAAILMFQQAQKLVATDLLVFTKESVDPNRDWISL